MSQNSPPSRLSARKAGLRAKPPSSCKGQCVSPVTRNFVLTDGPSKNISTAGKAEHLAMKTFLRVLPSGSNKDGPKVMQMLCSL